MFKLISVTKDVPKSLFVTSVTNLEIRKAGGFGRVYRGLHEGKTVAVKELFKVCHDVCGFPSLSFQIMLIYCKEFTPNGLVQRSYFMAIIISSVYPSFSGNI